MSRRSVPISSFWVTWSLNAASLGFMMPVSSPCNAIVYGSGRIPLRAMMASGAILDVIGAVVIASVVLAAAGWLG